MANNEHHHTAEDLVPSRLRRFAPVITAVVGGLVLIGYLSGVAEPYREVDLTPPRAEVPAAEAPPAVDYAQLPEANLKPNKGSTQPLGLLAFRAPSPFEPVQRTKEMKLASIADRARNRAFDTAPPTSPHPTAGLSDEACLSCHGKGLLIGEVVATRMCHERLSNCTQCHVEQTRSNLPWEPTEIENDFDGLVRAGPGDRAYPGAAPTIPHTTWMRQDCLSCHGLVARPGLRTTHPYLANCRQCHVASAGNDQLDFTGFPDSPSEGDSP